MKATHEFQNFGSELLQQPRHVIWLHSENPSEEQALKLLSDRTNAKGFIAPNIQLYCFSLPLKPTPKMTTESLEAKPYPMEGLYDFDTPCPRCGSKWIRFWLGNRVMCANCTFGISYHDVREIAVAELRGKYLEREYTQQKEASELLAQLQRGSVPAEPK